MRNGLYGVLTALTIVLAGCGDSNDAGTTPEPSSPSTPTTPPAPPTPPTPPTPPVPVTTDIVIAPSLGLVKNATIVVTDLQGNVLGQGVMASSGSIAVPHTSSNDGLIIELRGGSDVVYFDEASGIYKQLPADHTLHAISGTTRAAMTVTAITEIIYQRAKYLATGGTITPAMVQQAEADIASAFLPVVATGSALDAPAIIGDTSTIPDISTPTGAYAALLAAWSEYALLYGKVSNRACTTDVLCSPLPDLIDAVAKDLSDGVLNGYLDALPVLYGIFFRNFQESMMLGMDLSNFPDFIAYTDDLVIESRIGSQFAGTYSLSCTNTDAVTTPAHLIIRADGSSFSSGEFGTLILPAESGGGSELQTDGTNTTVLRSMAFETYTTILSYPVPPAQTRKIGFSSTGSGQIVVNSKTWTCSGFPQETISIPSMTLPLASWITADTYHCEKAGTITLVDATFNGQVMTIENNSWNLDAPTSLAMFQEDANGFLTSRTANSIGSHYHRGDDLAYTESPMEQLQLTFGDLSSVRFKHSMVTGKSYFDVLANGTPVYVHCQASVPVISTCSSTASFC